ncbi:helix-turn-helix transcriptional regulator [Actinoplanes ianthinogenes]|uniref:Helix-turn-helix transcriptional regulator n=1 Tax=Actinoplanes ianthinogenes TaxID=122358 RepID=A0ABN6CSE4_9ACTN|nr:LuxR family transcriptional regulator [Actinoplanes ianthinogenes]BCJ48171.1 helix-turn-helix transcriptional regulator [Actinoplanes ianthinogenes]GGR06940.1 helix-turn-helix transcriptional regulator [Actinoplanes ianthinogenes]
MAAWKGFVGRAAELAALAEALDDAARSDPRTVLIAGEAGVGKTRLLDEFEARCAGEDLLVARGACVSVGAGELPYSPWLAAMHAVEAEVGADALVEGARGDQAALSALIPALTDSGLPREGGQLARAHLFSLFLELLGRLAAQRPLVLLLEDLHWADTSSLDLLLFLSRNLRHVPVLLAGTFRTDELDEDSRHRVVIGELIRGRATTYLELNRFDRVELGVFLRASGGAVSDRIIAKVHERSGGNAFLAQEILAAEQRNPGGPVPDHLRDLLMMRVDGLSEEGQQIVGVVAAAGRPVSGALLEAASGLPGPALRSGLRDAVTRQVLVRTTDGSYQLRHSLTAETFYQDLLPGERAGLHRAVAAALSVSAGPDASPVVQAELAHHWFHGRKDDDALFWTLRAARSAALVHAYAEARRQYGRVLELWRRVPDAFKLCQTTYPRLLDEAAEVLDYAGDPQRAVELTGEAIQVVGVDGDPQVLAALHEHLARLRWRAHDTPGAVDSARNAIGLLDGVPQSPLQARAGATFARVLMLSGHYRQALAEGSAALEVATEPVERGYLLVTLGTVRFLLGERDAGVEQLWEGLALAESTDSKENILRAYTNLSYCLQMLNRLDEGLALARRGCDLAAGFGMRMTTGTVLVGNAADILLDLGRWDEIEKLIGEVLPDEAADDLPLYLQYVRAEVFVARDERGAARDILDRVMGRSAGKTDQDFVGHVYAALAALEIADGNWRAARRAVDEGLAKLGDGEGVFPALRLAVCGLQAAGEAVAKHATRERWQAWANVLAERADASMAALRAPSGGRALPVAEALYRVAGAELRRIRGEPQEEAWTEVAQTWAELGHPYPEAQARLRLAACLLRRGATAAMHRELTAAAQLAAGLGARRLTHELDAMASLAGVSLFVSPASAEPAGDHGPDWGLTPRETQVLDLIALGYTNSRIARSLDIAEKTVSVHVSNILAKLGAANRWEAALIRRGPAT